MADRTLGRDTGGFRKEIELREDIRRLILSTGAIAVGFARAGNVDENVSRQYEHWIDSRANGGMDYLKNHLPLRRTTDSVLPGARTVISIAYGYDSGEKRDESLPVIARYAFGDDYHEVLREVLNPVITKINILTGGNSRICIDSAPVAERYWARRAGIGIIGRNGALIVPGYGSFVFLAEIITTAELPEDAASTGSCLECGACMRVCPGKAINDDGTIDSRRCISYLTIEHKGDWDDTGRRVVSSANMDFLYGCDLCLSVCPHNKGNKRPAVIEALEPRTDILNLTAEEVIDMPPTEFSKRFRKSPIKRCKLTGLQRNALKGK